MPTKKKYKVKAGESFATFPDPQQVMSLNPGVPSLSTGQTIFLPTFNNPGTQNRNQNATFTMPGQSTFTPSYSPAPVGANSFYSGSQVNTGAFNVGAPQINPAYANQPEFLSPVGVNAPATASTLTGANSFQSGNQVNNQADLQMIVNGSVAQPGAASTNTPAPTSITLPPNYVYTGGNDPASVEQRRQWNIAAGGTGDERVFLMSREQKKAIGDAKRRKRGQTNRQVELAAAQAVQVVQEEAPSGHMVNSALSWRVG